MLAQNFKSAADLGITEPQKEALMKTLVLMETGKLTHVPALSERAQGTVNIIDEYRDDAEFTGHFNMGRWRSARDCGTVCCIAGTAEIIGNVRFSTSARGALGNLFWVGNSPCGDISHITPAQAARALRSYLSTGDAKWHEAVA